MLGGGGAAGAGEGAAGCNDKNKKPTIECGEKRKPSNKQETSNKQTTPNMVKQRKAFAKGWEATAARPDAGPGFLGLS